MPINDEVVGLESVSQEVVVPLKLGKQGRTTVPKEVRELFGVDEGDFLIVKVVGVKKVKEGAK